MRRLRHLSIKQKLTGIILLVTISALVAGFSFIFFINIGVLKENLRSTAVMHAQLIAEDCAPVMGFILPEEDIQPYLQKFRDVDGIIAIEVYDINKKLVTSLNKSDSQHFPHKPELDGKEPQINMTDESFHVSQAIYLGDERLGTLYLKMGTEALKDKIFHSLMTITIVFVVLLIFSFLLARRLQNHISDRILKLAAVSREISENKDYSVRVDKQGEDEIGTLYDEFNNMLEQIQQKHLQGEKAEVVLRFSEQALKESESRLNSILSSMVDLVFVFDKDGRFIFHRAPDGELFLPPERFYGKRYTEVMPPQTIEVFEDAFSKNKKGQVSEYEYSLEMDGQVKGYSAKLSPMFADHEFSGALAVTRNITRRKLMEENLKKAEEKYRQIFEHATLGIFQTTDEGRLLTANPAFARILGYDHPEELPRNISIPTEPLYVNSKRRGEFTRRMEKNGLIRDFEFRAFRKDKSIIHVSINAHEVRDKDGNLQFYEGLLEDVTQKRRAEEFKIAKEAAEEASRAKSDFLANMSHEIRTPMNAILGFSELLEEIIEDKQQKSYLSAITSSGRTLLSLINDILDLSKIEAGKLDIQFTTFNPVYVCNEVKQIFSRKIADKGLEFYMEIDPQLPEGVMLDEIRLRQILFNLVGNSVKFTDEGYIKLQLKHRYAKKEKGRPPAGLELIFTVEDTGIGIQSDQKDLIFEAFKQQKGQSAGKYGGTGLGLSITRRLVEIMGGTISLESQIGKGSKFHVTFKNVREMKLDDVHENSERIDHHSLVFEPATILIVDEIYPNRQLLMEFLNFPGLDFLEAENGREAVDVAREHHPDLIFMDMKMPVMDGYQATNIIKGSKDLAQIPVIVLTANALKEQEQEVLQMGCDGYLRKPVNRTELLMETMAFLPYTNNAEIAAAEAEPDFMEHSDAISADTSAYSGDNLQKLLELMEGDLMENWHQINHTFFVDEIEYFASTVKELGDKYNMLPLRDWGQQLMEQVKSFDMEKIPGTLKGYPSLVEILKQKLDAMPEDL